MAGDLLVQGPDERVGTGITWRADRTTRALTVAIAASLAVGIGAARSIAPAAVTAPPPVPVVQPLRVAVRSVDPAAGARIGVVPGGMSLRPVDGPSTAAARRVAQIVTSRVCRNIERPRYRREAGTPDGRTSSYVVGRASDMPHKSAGFLLELTWDGAGYIAKVSGAYGGCDGG